MRLIEVRLPQSKYGRKCPYKMDAKFVVIHNTWNTASARAEIAYMQRNDNATSFHFAVDENEAVQGLPLDRNSWNAGDGGNGIGNRDGISIEICRSRSDLDLFLRAEDNGARLTAMILKDKGWTIKQVKKHQDFSGKYCPHRTLDLGWPRFLELVEKYLAELNRDVDIKQVAPSPTPQAKPSELSQQVGKYPGIYKEYAESGRFYPTQNMNVRRDPSTRNQPVAKYRKGTVIPSKRTKYDRVYIGNGYVWIRYTGSTSGEPRFVAVRPIDKPRGYWGDCNAY